MAPNDQLVIKEVLKQRSGDLSKPISESRFFELFTAEQILKDYDVSWEEIESGIVGDGGDGGVDGFYHFLNGELVREDTDVTYYKGDISIELHIIQSKRHNGFSEDTVQKLRFVTENLLDLSNDLSEFNELYNSNLLFSAEKFRETYTKYASKLPEFSISYYYATLGDEVHPNVKKHVKSLQETVGKLFSSSHFSFDFIGARELLELTRRKPRTIYELKLSDSPIATENNGYICLVHLDDYNKFITNDDGVYIKTIFDSNVRDHQGNVQVNRGIRESLSKPFNEDFWWLNNGITILASKAILSAKTLTLENPRVVNGLQTSFEINKFFREEEKGEDKRSLLVRVIVPKEQESYERIIKATNSQTSIPVASLRATDRIHRDIEDYFKGKGLFYDRRKNQYKNEGKPLDRIVSISYVAQSVMTVVLGKPDDARARPSTLLKKDEDYLSIFNENYSPEVYLNCTLFLKRTEDYIRKNYPELTRKEVNNLKFHVAMFSTRYFLNKLDPLPADVAYLDIDSIGKDTIDKSFLETRKIFRSLGGDDKVSKGKEFLNSLKNRLSELTYIGRIT